MKFLDRFKRKPPTEPPLPEQHKAPEQKKPPESASGNKAEAKAAPGSALSSPSGHKKPGTSDNDLRLELGDFLHRIPAHLLLPGPHDLKSELRFDIADLSARISKGQTTISLAEIYRRVPTIFRGEILDSDNIEVRFPWQKLAKLVNLGKPEGQPADTAPPAPALAEKLRAKKPANQAKKNAALSEDQASATLPWRSATNKPASGPNKSDSAATPAHAPSSGKKSADMSALPPPPASVQPVTLKLQTASPAAEAGPNAEPAKASDPNLPRPTPEDLKIVDLPVDIQRRFALLKGEYERQLIEANTNKKSIAEARDRANSEVERLKKELDRNLNLLAKEQTSSTLGHEVVQRHQIEREELQAQIDALKAQLSGTDGASAENAQSDEQVAALALERDTLLEQKAYLTKQLAELANRRGNGSSGGVPSHAQRQVEDLQRRILLLESAQKDAAQVLQREKEAKFKIEKLLANADRLHQERAFHMEEAKVEMRKDIEAQFRKNIKELEEQLAIARSQPAPPAPAPEPAAPAWQVEALAQLEADIETYRTRMKVIIRERDEARAASQAIPAAEPGEDVQSLKQEFEKAQAETLAMRAQLEELQNRETSTQGLEAELENSRQRIAQLQAELVDALEKASHGETATSTLDETRRNLEQQSAHHADEVRRLANEHDARVLELTSALDATKGTQSQHEEAAQEIARLRDECERAGASLSEARLQLEETRRQLEDRNSSHAAELQKLADEKDAQIRSISETLESARSRLNRDLTEGDEIASLRLEFEKLAARQNEERRQFDAERNDLLEKHKAAATTAQEQFQCIQQQLQMVIEERNQLNSAKESILAEIASEKSAHQEHLYRIEEEHASVAREKESLLQKLDDAEGVRRQLEELRNQPPDPALTAENSRIRAELEEARQLRDAAQRSLEAQTSTLHEIESRLNKLTAENQEFIARIQESEHLLNVSAQTTAARIEGLEAERTGLAARLAETDANLAGITAEKQALAFTLAEVEQKHADHSANFQVERENFQSQLASFSSEREVLAGELSASRKQHQQFIASLDHERGELITAREAIQKQLADAEREVAELKASLHDAGNALTAERQKSADALAKLNDQFQADATEIENRHAAELTALNAELDNIRRQLSGLHEASAKERDSLEARLAAQEQARIAELQATRAELEKNAHAAQTSLSERLAAAEQERATLQASVVDVSNYENTIATLRAGREQAVEALAAAEQRHTAAAAEAEQRLRDSHAGPAREIEQARIAADALRAELTVARRMQSEVVLSLNNEREQFAAVKADLERKLEAVDEGRRQMSSRLDDRDQAIRLLEEKVNSAEAAQQQQKAELTELRNSLTSAEQEKEQIAGSALSSERLLDGEIASLTQKVEQLVADKAELNERVAAIESSRRTESENAAAALDHAVSELEAERARRESERTTAVRERDDALRSAGQEIIRIEQELSRTREQRDILKREKEELARRVSQVTEQQKRMLDDIATGLGHTPASAPRPPMATVIEVTPEDSNFNIGRVRPVPVRPPQVKLQ